VIINNRMETILIQETDRSILDILTIALQMEGFDVFAMLADDQYFMDKIEETRPHVVLLDFRLDGQICIDMCRLIKNKYPHLPVLALSCNTNIDVVYDRYGFDGYIKKPFDIDQLYRILRKHMIKPEDAVV